MEVEVGAHGGVVSVKHVHSAPQERSDTRAVGMRLASVGYALEGSTVGGQYVAHLYRCICMCMCMCTGGGYALEGSTVGHVGGQLCVPP